MYMHVFFHGIDTTLDRDMHREFVFRKIKHFFVTCPLQLDPIYVLLIVFHREGVECPH